MSNKVNSRQRPQVIWYFHPFLDRALEAVITVVVAGVLLPVVVVVTLCWAIKQLLKWLNIRLASGYRLWLRSLPSVVGGKIPAVDFYRRLQG